MSYRGLHLPAAVLAFVLVLAVGLLGKHVYEQNQIIAPLEAELQQVVGVKKVAVQRSRGGWGSVLEIYLDLDAQVPLGAALGRVRQIAADFGENLVIHLRDSASPELLQLYEQVQLAAEEAVITGKFTLLAERVGQLAGSRGAGWELSVDRNFIYISLTDGEHTLRRVISRAPEGQELEFHVDGGAWG